MRPNPASSGFTLLETVLSLALLAFFLVGLASLTVSTIQTNTQARRMTAATALVQAKLEQLSNTTYSAVASSGLPLEVLTETGATAGDTFYTRSWTVTDNSPIVNTKTIQVTVAWTDKLGSHQAQLQMIITP
jgi:type II secretory pathway pseudopilin PulG